ncbi:D-alanine--D-alanine ligase [Buchnera aphidicola str. Ak (Acyrthosiphon kondoi)]|uniref:D-alanine--D-alanine ligase n=1 Tax=Buchnera aphidicola str. Ak (Acyrthosiphon kondoi) TaxID=1005090 RepID=G2LMT4_9GAMM|nr:D-alanine--D-alanine ligase [Buchnera aphidicola]AEO08572.1 D-alanine--D-alanine ligase [Buchnera aphidicola str. Ak (Acyrthosiphon kondoi)]
MNKKIAVLLGGTSSERKISIQSGYAILESLLKSGLNAYPIDTRDHSIIQLKKEGFNKVYISLHGKGGEDGSVQGVLQYLNIPYTGSGIMASSISIDKFRTKLLWKSRGLLTAPDIYISKKKNISSLYNFIIKKILKLGFPILIKPNNQGSSIGITIVSCFEQLDDAINIAFSYSNDILIEKFIKGKEYTVPILGEQVLPPICISTNNNFYDYNAKYISSSTQYFCPSGLNTIQEIELKKIAMLAWNTLGCSGCGRIDVILDDTDKFWLLEVNTIPGMTNRSLVPMSAKEIGISFDELVLFILNMNNKKLF